LNRLAKRIEMIMSDDSRPPFFSLATLLWTFSLGYGAAMKIRAHLYRARFLASYRLPCKVISVGNLTVGGTGKTPISIYLAKLLLRLGYRVAIISRGYKGKAENAGGIVSDGQTCFMGADAAGDEPFMLASQLEEIPVIVGKDRVKAGMCAVNRFSADVIVLDDGFQHLRLKRDINLALLDFSQPLGNGYLLPRGILREPAAMLARSDALILSRVKAASQNLRSRRPTGLTEQWIDKKPVFKTIHRPVIAAVVKPHGRWSGKRHIAYSKTLLFQRKVFAFSGIGNNSDFVRTLASFNCDLKGALGFSDHHPYSSKDVHLLWMACKQAHADIMVTTEKDMARMGYENRWPVELIVVGIDVFFQGQQSAFDDFIANSLDQNGSTR
jgi:tetraacyldisaccharide 4'-kinase